MTTHESKITRAEGALGYEFQDKLRCLEALQTSGYALTWRGEIRQVRNNDNLAMLGDIVMKAVLCKKWYGSNQPKRQWTVAEQELVKTGNLSKIGREKGLDNCIILNPGTNNVSEKTMATTVQALVGAVYCDGGEKALIELFDALKLDNGYFEQVMLIPRQAEAKANVFGGGEVEPS